MRWLLETPVSQLLEAANKLLSAPSGIFGLSVFWAWAIPLALAAANVFAIYLIRRDNRAYEQASAAVALAERLMGPPLETARAEFHQRLAETEAARVFSGNPYIDAPSAPSRERYEAFLATRIPPDDDSFLRSIGIKP